MKPRILLALLFALLVALCAFGQTFQRSLPFLAKSGSVSQSQEVTYPGLAYWWDSSNLVAGAVASWTDRVQQVVFKMDGAALRPLMTSTGVNFTSGSSQELTNSLPPYKLTNFVGGNFAAVQLIFINKSSSLVADIMSDSTGTRPGYGFNSGVPFYYHQDQGGIAQCPSGIPANMVYDWTIINHTNGHIQYTNGVLALAKGGQLITFNSIIQFGHGADGYYNGTIKEMLFWSNHVDPTNIADIHNRATNKWKFGP